MTTGERIRTRRKELGITADALAEKIGVSRSTIFRYESGDIEKLPMDYLPPIAVHLNTTIAYLMGWEQTSELQDSETRKLATTMDSELENMNGLVDTAYKDAVITLNEMLGQLDEEDYALVQAYADGLSARRKKKAP